MTASSRGPPGASAPSGHRPPPSIAAHRPFRSARYVRRSAARTCGAAHRSAGTRRRPRLAQRVELRPPPPPLADRRPTSRSGPCSPAARLSRGRTAGTPHTPGASAARRAITPAGPRPTRAARPHPLRPGPPRRRQSSPWPAPPSPPVSAQRGASSSATSPAAPGHPSRPPDPSAPSSHPGLRSAKRPGLGGERHYPGQVPLTPPPRRRYVGTSRPGRAPASPRSPPTAPRGRPGRAGHQRPDRRRHHQPQSAPATPPPPPGAPRLRGGRRGHRGSRVTGGPGRRPGRRRGRRRRSRPRARPPGAARPGGGGSAWRRP